MKTTHSIIIILGMIILTFIKSLNAQNPDPVTLGEEFPDFTLISHTGDSVSLHDYEGQNVILVFPRGRFMEGWCRACHYMYADLAELQIKDEIEKKYDLKILFILPYPEADIKDWTEAFPAQMKIIEQFKYPPEERQDDPRFMNFAQEMKMAMPKDFSFDEENPAPLPFPVLADTDHKLSSSLKLYSTNWTDRYFEQNEPTIFILDKNGVVQFKYHSQVTLDRPKADYLINYIDKVMD
ncbi:peroxiredoxin family protein [Bacteroidota bacterium]